MTSKQNDVNTPADSDTPAETEVVTLESLSAKLREAINAGEIETALSITEQISNFKPARVKPAGLTTMQVKRDAAQRVITLVSANVADLTAGYSEREAKDALAYFANLLSYVPDASSMTWPENLPARTILSAERKRIEDAARELQPAHAGE